MADPTSEQLVEWAASSESKYRPGMIDPDLAQSLSTAAEKARTWTKRRDQLIRQASAAGGSLGEIGQRVGMTKPGVKRVLDRAPTD